MIFFTILKPCHIQHQSIEVRIFCFSRQLPVVIYNISQLKWGCFASVTSYFPTNRVISDSISRSISYSLFWSAISSKCIWGTRKPSPERSDSGMARHGTASSHQFLPVPCGPCQASAAKSIFATFDQTLSGWKQSHHQPHFSPLCSYHFHSSAALPKPVSPDFCRLALFFRRSLPKAMIISEKK